MKKNPPVNELQNNPDFEHIQSLNFDDVIPFVLKNIKLKSISGYLYFISNLALLCFLVWKSILLINDDLFGVKYFLNSLLLGLFAGGLLVIIPHELLHAIAYFVIGVRKIRFGADFNQMIFYVTADHAVVNKRQLYFVALSPFVTINVFVLIYLNGLSPYPQLGFITFLLIHNIMCIGDFAILSFLEQYPGAKVYSYDIIAEKKTLFYKETRRN